LRKLNEFDAVSAYTKNYHDIYVGMHEAINQIEIDQIGQVHGHQDKSGQELNHIKKLNVLADELAMRAIKEFDSSKLEWNSEIGPIPKIDGAPITNKEEMLLSIAVEREEFE
jgi:hypothetical protein